MALSGKAFVLPDGRRPSPAVPCADASTPARLGKLSLGKNFSWTLVGNVTFAACQWLNLVVLAKLCDPIAVGRFALGLAVTTPVFMLANLQLRSVQATDAARSYQFGHYLALRLITTAVALAAMPLVTWLAGYSGSARWIILVLAVGKAFDAVTDVAFGLVQQCERLDRGARARIISGVASLAGLSIGVATTGAVLWGAVGWCLGPFVTVLTIRVWMGADIWYAAGGGASGPRPLFDRQVVRRLVLLSLPLGLAMMLVSLNLNVPRYLVEHLRSEYELGIYAAMAYLMVAGQIVTGALGQAATPRLAEYFYHANRIAFGSLLRRLLLLALVGGVLGLLLAATIGRPLLALLYTPEYAEYRTVLLLLTVAAGMDFANSFLGEAMTAARRFRQQIPLFFAVTATTALGCVVLIPRVGLAGAALGSLAGALCQFIGAAWIVSRAVGTLGEARA